MSQIHAFFQTLLINVTDFCTSRNQRNNNSYFLIPKLKQP